MQAAPARPAQEGVGTRLRDAFEERMAELRHAAEARREARGAVALEPENNPATWPDARLVAYLQGVAGPSAHLESAPRAELVRRAHAAMGRAHAPPSHGRAAPTAKQAASPARHGGGEGGTKLEAGIGPGGEAGVGPGGEHDPPPVSSSSTLARERGRERWGAARSVGASLGPSDVGSAQDEVDIALFRHLAAPRRGSAGSFCPPGAAPELSQAEREVRRARRQHKLAEEMQRRRSGARGGAAAGSPPQPQPQHRRNTCGCGCAAGGAERGHAGAPVGKSVGGCGTEQCAPPARFASTAPRAPERSQPNGAAAAGYGRRGGGGGGAEGAAAVWEDDDGDDGDDGSLFGFLGPSTGTSSSRSKSCGDSGTKGAPPPARRSWSSSWVPYAARLHTAGLQSREKHGVFQRGSAQHAHPTCRAPDAPPPAERSQPIRAAAAGRVRRGSGSGGGSSGGGGSGGGEADEVADRAAAVRRVSAWAADKDVYALLGSVRELGLEGRPGHSEPPPPRPGAGPAALKKAFLCASLALHPDRLQGSGMSSQRKAEAEEVFKTLAAAYHHATNAGSELEA